MKGKNNHAQAVATKDALLKLRLPLTELHSINAHCLTHGLNRSQWTRATLKAAILKATAYQQTPVTIDPADAAVMARTGGTIREGTDE
jgi:hypothetical protein